MIDSQNGKVTENFFGEDHDEQENDLFLIRYLAKVGRIIGISPRELRNADNTINNSNAGIPQDFADNLQNFIGIELHPYP